MLVSGLHGHIDVGRCGAALSVAASHVGQPGEVRVGVGQPGALPGLHEPHLVDLLRERLSLLQALDLYSKQNGIKPEFSFTDAQLVSRSGVLIALWQARSEVGERARTGRPASEWESNIRHSCCVFRTHV